MPEPMTMSVGTLVLFSPLMFMVSCVLWTRRPARRQCRRWSRCGGAGGVSDCIGNISGLWGEARHCLVRTGCISPLKRIVEKSVLYRTRGNVCPFNPVLESGQAHTDADSLNGGFTGASTDWHESCLPPRCSPFCARAVRLPYRTLLPSKRVR